MEIKYCPLSSVEQIFSETKEQNIDCEIILPDYCSSIQKILACTVECFNENVAITGDKLNTDAYAAVKLLYVGEENKIRVFSQDVSFSKSTVFDRVSENDLLSVTHKIVSVSTRVTAQRRVEVHAVTAVCFEISRYTTHKYVQGTADDMLQCRTQNRRVFDCSALFSDTFDVRESCGEDFPIDNDSAIIRKNAFAVCNEYKAVKNKLMVKGICEVQIAYTSDGENISVYRNNIPFTNVFDISGVNEGDVCYIAMSCEHIRLTRGERDSGALGEVSVKVRIDARCGKISENQIVVDAYLPGCDVDIKKISENIISNIVVCDRVVTSEIVVDSFDENLTDVLDCWTEKLSYEYKTDGKRIIINGGVLLTAVVKTDKDEFLCIMRNASFEDVIENETDDANRVLVASLSKNTMSAVILGDGKMKFKTDFRLLGYTIENVQLNGLSSIVCAEEGNSQENNSAEITVYFADAGENLWDIAKNNKTTVASIKRFNENTEENISERKVLILPSSF